MDRFIHNFFNLEVIAKYLPAMINGFYVTLQLAILIVLSGLIFGLALATLRAFQIKPINWFIIFWIYFFRAVPPLVIRIISYRAFPYIWDKTYRGHCCGRTSGCALVHAAFSQRTSFGPESFGRTKATGKRCIGYTGIDLHQKMGSSGGLADRRPFANDLCGTDQSRHRDHEKVVCWSSVPTFGASPHVMADHRRLLRGNCPVDSRRKLSPLTIRTFGDNGKHRSTQECRPVPPIFARALDAKRYECYDRADRPFTYEALDQDEPSWIWLSEHVDFQFLLRKDAADIQACSRTSFRRKTLFALVQRQSASERQVGPEAKHADQYG